MGGRILRRPGEQSVRESGVDERTAGEFMAHIDRISKWIKEGEGWDPAPPRKLAPSSSMTPLVAAQDVHDAETKRATIFTAPGVVVVPIPGGIEHARIRIRVIEQRSKGTVRVFPTLVSGCDDDDEREGVVIAPSSSLASKLRRRGGHVFEFDHVPGKRGREFGKGSR